MLNRRFMLYTELILRLSIVVFLKHSNESHLLALLHFLFQTDYTARLNVDKW